MKCCRVLAVLVLTAGLVVLTGDSTVADDVTAKQDKKAERKALLEAAKAKAAEAAKAEAAKPAEVAKPAPARPTAVTADPTALARLIDDHVSRKLAEGKVPSSPVSSDEEFLRRVYLDITGVIPSADQAKAFLDSTDADKRAKLIDELLASPNFGRRLSDIWQAKLFPRDSGNRFVLRDPLVAWLAEKFNANTPWDEFVTQLVTATGTVEANPAVTYFLANRSVDKLTDGVTQHFMGVQLQCAQCHNHPFTAWKQTEYWGMASFFSKVQPQNPKNANKGGDNTKIGVQETATRTKLKDFFPESTKVVTPKFLGGAEVTVGASEPLRPVLAKWLTAPENPYFAKAMVNRTWALLFSQGFVNPVDDMNDDNPPSHPELMTELARQFAAGGYDVKALYRAICNSQAYQRSSKPLPTNAKDHELFSHMAVKVMTPEQLYDSLSAVTGTGGAPTRPAPKGGRGPAGGRDGFVQFFLAGADAANPAEYEAGIPQALRLMNSRISGNPVFVKALMTAGGNDPAKVIERVYLATLSRRPTAAETKRLSEYVSKSGNPTEAYSDVLWAVLNSSEFTMVR